jgi:hypothetical protein
MGGLVEWPSGNERVQEGLETVMFLGGENGGAGETKCYYSVWRICKLLACKGGAASHIQPPQESEDMQLLDRWKLGSHKLQVRKILKEKVQRRIDNSS